MAAAAERSGNSGAGTVLALLAVGAGGYYAYKHWLKPDVIMPVKMKQAILRMQITGAKAGLNIPQKKLWISFKINNPNNEPLKVSAIVGHMTIFQVDPKKPGLRLGNVDQFKPIIIQPLAATPVTLTVDLKTLPVISYLVQVFTGKWKGQILDFQGTINAQGKPWPIHERLKLSQ